MTDEGVKAYEKMSEDDFLIYVTIEGTDREDIGIFVSDPYLPLKAQLQRMVKMFDLPRVDLGGNLVEYLLGRYEEDDPEPMILEFEDEDGREQSLMDHNVQPGEHLILTSIPVCGRLLVHLITVKTLNFLLFRYQYLRILRADDKKQGYPSICGLYGTIETHIKEMVNYFKLNKRRRYFLAKVYNRDEELKFYFLNGKAPVGSRWDSILEDADMLEYNYGSSDPYPYVLLFPATGITGRILKKLKKITNIKPRFIEI